MVHHIRREGVLDPSYLHIRKIFFSKTRQIFVSPVPGKIIPAIPRESDLTGSISVVRHDPFNNGVTYGRKMNFFELNLLARDGECGLSLYNTDYEGRIFIQDGAVYFSVVSGSGECVWGRSH